jgi:hypothetical protein
MPMSAQQNSPLQTWFSEESQARHKRICSTLNSKTSMPTSAQLTSAGLHNFIEHVVELGSR